MFCFVAFPCQQQYLTIEMEKDRYLTNDLRYSAHIYDELNGKLVNYLWKYFEKCLSQQIMKQIKLYVD